MENTKHTPGPWAIRYGGGIDMRIIAEDFGRVCDIEGPQTTDLMDAYEDVFLANAKLIAAAPELLEALQTLLEACYLADSKEELSEDVDGGLLDLAQKAIRKATE